MKQKRLMLLAAAVAVMLAACEPENVVTPEPEPTPSGPTYLTSLVGTVWNYHQDRWMENVPNYGTVHMVVDNYYSFLTDSSGRRRMYSPGAENFPAMDVSAGFYYAYDTMTRIGVIEDSGFNQINIYDFRYDPATETIIMPANDDSGAVYIRVQ